MANHLKHLKVEYVPIDTITPYSGNAKLHPDEQIDEIIASIELVGFRDPIGVWNNEIVEGHGRYMAAKKIGMQEIPVIRLDDLTDEERRAYMLIHNKTTMDSGWDFDKLSEELDALADEIDMELFGFDVGDQESSEVVEDEYEEKSTVEPKAKRGDIFQLGRHRLMCGDSTSTEDVQLLMGGVQADMVFTDPPYGVAIGDKNKTLNSIQKAGRCTENIENDTLSEEELYDTLKKAFQNVKANCAEDAVYYVTSPQGGSLGLMMMMMMRDAGLPVRHVLMWKKNSATFSLGRLDYDYQHEPIFYTWGEKHHNYRGGECRTTVWEYDKPRKCDLHPTMKPVALVANAILDGSKTGDNVLDVFGGSGTTLIAAEQTGRNCYMMELDPHYVDVIIDRWEQLTGEKAVLLDG